MDGANGLEKHDLGCEVLISGAKLSKSSNCNWHSIEPEIEKVKVMVNKNNQ